MSLSWNHSGHQELSVLAGNFGTGVVPVSPIGERTGVLIHQFYQALVDFRLGMNSCG